ncbi:MAG: hypothetical protein R6U57_03540 [Anaerolineales bacterium]
MTTQNLGTSTLIGVMTTTPLTTVLFLAQHLIGFSFPPYESSKG